MQAACGYAAARLMIILPQTYIPLYFLNTLHMDKVGVRHQELINPVGRGHPTSLHAEFHLNIGSQYCLGSSFIAASSVLSPLTSTFLFT